MNWRGILIAMACGGIALAVPAYADEAGHQARQQARQQVQQDTQAIRDDRGIVGDARALYKNARANGADQGTLDSLLASWSASVDLLTGAQNLRAQDTVQACVIGLFAYCPPPDPPGPPLIVVGDLP